VKDPKLKPLTAPGPKYIAVSMVQVRRLNMEIERLSTQISALRASYTNLVQPDLFTPTIKDESNGLSDEKPVVSTGSAADNPPRLDAESGPTPEQSACASTADDPDRSRNAGRRSCSAQPASRSGGSQG